MVTAARMPHGAPFSVMPSGATAMSTAVAEQTGFLAPAKSGAPYDDRHILGEDEALLWLLSQRNQIYREPPVANLTGTSDVNSAPRRMYLAHIPGHSFYAAHQGYLAGVSAPAVPNSTTLSSLMGNTGLTNDYLIQEAKAVR